jgi:hypothetical protein
LRKWSQLALAVFFLFRVTIDERADERGHRNNDCRKPLDAFSLRKQINTTTDDHESKNKSEPLSSTLGVAVALNNHRFMLLSVFRLPFCHRNNTLGAPCKRVVVTFEKLRVEVKVQKTRTY